jgi:hypothetical protein
MGASSLSQRKSMVRPSTRRDIVPYCMGMTPPEGHMALHVGRREFIATLSGVAAWPLLAGAQQAGKVYRIGLLANDPTIPSQPAGEAFLDGLRENGFFEGKNIIIERRFAEGRLDQYAMFATELVRLSVDIIVVSSQPALLAAKQASNTIPIVMVNGLDPVAQGIVPSLAHPGGNITGLTMEESAAPKRCYSARYQGGSSDKSRLPLRASAMGTVKAQRTVFKPCSTADGCATGK